MQKKGTQTKNAEDEGYDLNRDQASAVEALAGREFFDDRHICQLTCNVV